ncbi:COP1-interacting protein [Salix suchowensis]|nr:COP1-interacting protein [Salix suchowensis]
MMNSRNQLFVEAINDYISRKEWLRAVGLRLTALKRELAAALSRAFGAICSCKEITYLVEFCEYFGATDLNQKGEAAVLLNDDKNSSAIDKVSKMDEDTPISRPIYSILPTSDQNKKSAERSRAISRSAAPRRERTSSHRDEDEISTEDEGSEQSSKKPGSNVRRMSVQDAISLFERKQKPCNDVADKEISMNLIQEKLESDITSGCQNPVDTAEADGELERWEEKGQHRVDFETDANAPHGKERNRGTPDSVEWSWQKEAELNQMLMKMMESQPVKTQRPKTVKNQNIPSEQKGGDRKLRGVNAEKRAEKEVQFRAMQQILDGGNGKKHPPRIAEKSLNNPSQPANLRKDSPKSSVMKKVSSKTLNLPANHKSWPSAPPIRAPLSSPLKTPSGISSGGDKPRGQKPQSSTILPRSNPKVERSQPQHRNVKETRTEANKSLKGVKDKMQQTAMKSGKTTKKKFFYNKATKNSSVVQVESKPFLRKVSRSGHPIVNKIRDCSQQEESSVNCGNKSETKENEAKENEVVVNASCMGEIEEQQNLSRTNDDGSTQLSSPVLVAPVGLPSQRVRHYLSQMLQEDKNTEPDTVEWGNAENPPAVVYQKDAPKGLKKLLKFARKREDGEESKAINKSKSDNLQRKAALHKTMGSNRVLSLKDMIEM